MRKNNRGKILWLGVWFLSPIASADIIHFTGDGELYDFGLEKNGKGATVFLSDKFTNEPATDKKVEFVPNGEGNDVLFQQSSPGVYLAFMESDATPDGQIIVNYEQPGEDTIDIVQKGHEGHDHGDEGEEDHDDHGEGAAHSDDHAGYDDHDEHGDHDHGLLGELEHLAEGTGLWLAVGAGVLLFLLGWFTGRSRGGAAAAAIAVAAMVLYPAEKAWAGAGHAHAEVGIGDSGEGTIVKVTKRSQFLVGMRTVVAKVDQVADVFRTFGHAIAKPQLDAHVRAPRDGVLRDVDENIWGKRIKKGQMVARVDAVGLVPVRSPISGTVIQAQGVSGTRVNAGDDIVRIVDTSKLWIDAEVFQKDLAKVKQASSIYITLETGNGLITRQANLVGAQTVVDEHTMTGKIFLELDNRDDELSIGNTVQVLFKLDQNAVEGVLLPHSAVLYRGAETIVYIKTGPESFEPRPVAHQPGPDPGTVVVTQGLVEGDRVVTMGNYQLLVGAK